MITKELVIIRANELKKQAETLRSNLDATLGAIQDCGFWLKKLDEMEKQNAGDLPQAS